MSEDDRGFVIKDRRKLGEEEKVAEKPTEPTQTGTSGQESPPERESGPEMDRPANDEAGEQRQSAQLPEVTFSTFIWSLFSSSLVHMGEAPDPSSGQTRKDLALAKHTIDMIAMLKDKTKGNLSSDEQQMIDYILYEMRMKYLNVRV